MAATSTDPSRYIVGIDLGTTNSAVCFVDTERRPWSVRTFMVDQVVEPGVVERRETLPSFHYAAAEGEFRAGGLRCPWDAADPQTAVGTFAREHGRLVPGRQISSAKSWLCHSGVDRTADILPWQGADDCPRRSPIDVSASYLAHIRRAWDHHHPRAPLAEQEIVLTLPASFDEVARELTVRAARQAGLPRVVLIEEPQAAFYAWIDAHQDDWQQRVEPGQKILICDVGGGTSDFTLIRVRPAGEGRVQFHRVAVGEHLILGGDNLDLALAAHLEAKLADGGQIDGRAWGVLVRQCRQVKETLLGPDAPERVTVNLPGGGSRLIGGGRQVEVTRDEARELLVEGFFPHVDLDERPRGRESGFREFGLPFTPDAAITRYLAAFLTTHAHAGDALIAAKPTDGIGGTVPDVVLLNGAVFNSRVLAERLVEVIAGWDNKSPLSAGEGRGEGSTDETPVAPATSRPALLTNDRLDLAVARGAAYYGMVRRGEGVRIAAGLARSYYVGVEAAAGDSQQALCLVPAGTEPGSDVSPPRSFQLRVGEPVEFPLFTSSTRLTDPPGEVIAFDPEQLTALPPIRTVLRTRRRSEASTIDVGLHAQLSEIGTLELWCEQPDTRNRWRLQFDVRTATQTDVAAHEGRAETEGFVDEQTWDECRAALDATFGPDASAKPQRLIRRLTESLDMARDRWPASLLRRIWEALVELESGRRQSPTHEARWLNLLGFALRPGFGMAVDDWRVSETWRLVQGKLIHSTPQIRSEGWVLWRRVAGGLSPGQQQALADPLLAPIRAMHRQMTTGRGRGGDLGLRPHETAEVWRLLGGLELLPVDTKIELGQVLLDLIPKRKWEPVRGPMLWALGRVGARSPAYGPLNAVVPAEVAAAWLADLLDDRAAEPDAQLAVMQLARRTDDRYRDVPAADRERAAGWLTAADAPSHFIALIERGGTLDDEEQGLVFGESLPTGLRIG